MQTSVENEKTAASEKSTRRPKAKKPKGSTKAPVTSDTASAVAKQVDETHVVRAGDERSDTTANRTSTGVKRKRKHESKSREKNKIKSTATDKASGVIDAEESVAEQTKNASRTLALEYVRLWDTNRKAWKYSKKRQYWLLSHLYDTTDLPDEEFNALLSYMVELKGNAREVTLAEARKRAEAEEAEEEEEEIRRRAVEVLKVLV